MLKMSRIPGAIHSTLSRRHFLTAAAGLAACKATPGELPSTSTGAPAVTEARSVARLVAGRPTIEGAGVRLTRTIGGPLSELDPFLLLDDIHSADPRDWQKGFPTHPHRGFETVTIMLDGVVEHEDSLGNRGVLEGGGIQWMTAGHGIIHSEMPQVSGGPLWAMQLWVNLPKRLKMTSPRYQDIAPDRVPTVGGGSAARVLAGERDGARGPVGGIVTAPTMLDLTVRPRERFVHTLPESHTAFVYGLSGVALVGPENRPVRERELAVLNEGSQVLVAAGDEPARFLLVAAAPIGEPVARRGPFVMNTEEELDQAVEDYRTGRLVKG
jgi:redox-sensitive bicupin YhaK (pirin superfamily)